MDGVFFLRFRFVIVVKNFLVDDCLLKNIILFIVFFFGSVMFLMIWLRVDNLILYVVLKLFEYWM